MSDYIYLEVTVLVRHPEKFEGFNFENAAKDLGLSPDRRGNTLPIRTDPRMASVHFWGRFPMGPGLQDSIQRRAESALSPLGVRRVIIRAPTPRFM